MVLKIFLIKDFLKHVLRTCGYVKYGYEGIFGPDWSIAHLVPRLLFQLPF